MTATQHEQGYDPQVEGFDDDYSDRKGEATFRLVFNGFGFEWNTFATIAELPNIILELQAHDMKGANTPLLWPEDKPKEHRPVSAPTNGAAQHNGQPPAQAAPAGMQATGWDQQGNTTYAEVPQAPAPAPGQGRVEPPTQFNPATNAPYCPYHNKEMRPSNYGGWYCTGKGGTVAKANGWCSYQYKDGMASAKPGG